MLRKHTYRDELQQGKRALGPTYGTSPVAVHRHAISGVGSAAREHLFDKAVTPSDVGKLNRLVIPKQHAEKYFPLQIDGAVSRGTLLNLEDSAGKTWRFRYTYWNSSQSYVLTKGWSRFVKEKRLKAGDVVSFHRSTGPERQLYISRKRRVSTAASTLISGFTPFQPARPVEVMRLFGVNIVKEAGGAAVRGSDNYSMTGSQGPAPGSLGANRTYRRRPSCGIATI
ncbi:unnamed protein product [Spirodela intermedia]|uniref:TF-B3 domain-containing protein n=2 Tax=Spirodela intermedia TaxID=51605 RepID=A0A7I8KWJ7_SPIIN|nr:unnamed protein product [Spirodela intermedia]CAA6665420.1 unnamed protein product [Spirodela intermedia]CAA7402150.1 unnamed protein product [Spirodela intermedia]